jgi:F-type H+-transporting ATPase subunit delta
MQNPRLASRYAKSLLDLAVEQNSLEATLKDVQLLDTFCRQNPDLKSMLRSPVIRAEKKLKVLNAVFGDRISKLTEAFIALLTTKGREGTLPEMTTAFIAQYKELKSIRSVKLTTAVPLHDSVKEGIRAKVAAGMPNSSIELDTAVDAELIGGFVLEMDDKLFDASVRRDLSDIKAQFNDDSFVSKLN